MNSGAHGALFCIQEESSPTKIGVGFWMSLSHKASRHLVHTWQSLLNLAKGSLRQSIYTPQEAGRFCKRGKEREEEAPGEGERKKEDFH